MSWLLAVNTCDLHPGLVRVIEAMFSKLIAHSTPAKVYSGLRTFSEQNQLYAKGRTEIGRIVTKARAGESMHNYGLAVDLAPFNLETAKTWDLYWPEPNTHEGEIWYVIEHCLMEAAREIDAEDDDGLDYEWGGRWRWRDYPHCQARVTLREMKSGWYPPCRDVEWLVHAHTTFLFDTGWWIDRRVQFLLNQLGHDVGPVDAVIGQRTRAAIVDFEGSTLWVDTPVTKELVESLVRAAA